MRKVLIKMDFKLKKWIDNALNLPFKLIFDENVELVEKYLDGLNNADNKTNTRIDNIVLNSGGDSPNEVVDARTSAEGNVYPVLKGRLDAEYTTLANKDNEQDTAMDKLESVVNDLGLQLEKLYGLDDGNLDFFIDATLGNDETGNGSVEKPFQTIQKAVNEVPKVMAGLSINLLIVPGTYREDVVIDGIICRKLNIRGTNYSTINPATGSTGVQINSIDSRGVVGEVMFGGLEMASTAGVNKDFFINCETTTMARFRKCRFALNTKSFTKFSAVFVRSGNYDIGNSYFANQNWDVTVFDAANLIIQNDNLHGANSTVGLRSFSGIIYNILGTWAADTATSKQNGGQIFQ